MGRRADETLILHGGVRELEEVAPPVVGVPSMGETHYGDTHCGVAWFETPPPGPARGAAKSPPALREKGEGARASRAPKSPALTHYGEASPGAGPRRELSSASMRAAELDITEPRSKRASPRRARARSLRLGAWVLAGAFVGGGAAVSIISKLESMEAAPALSSPRQSALEVEVLGPEGTGLSGARVRLAGESWTTQADSPLSLLLPPEHAELRVDCPEGMRGGPLLRSFHGRLLPAERALRVRLQCRPVLQQLAFHFSSGACESTVSLSTGQVFETEGGTLKTRLEVDVESLGQLTIAVQLEDERCHFRGPAGPTREETRVVSLRGLESIELEMESERVRPLRSWQPVRPVEQKRPYRL